MRNLLDNATLIGYCNGTAIYRLDPQGAVRIEINTRRIHVDMWQQCRTAGMAYGNNHEGMMRWWKEQSFDFTELMP